MDATATQSEQHVEGWRTTDGPNGKAHYLVAPNRTACADQPGPWGVPMGELFTRPWRETLETDHICKRCAKVHPRTCACWSCSWKRKGKLR